MFDFSSDLHLDNAAMGGPFRWIGKIDVRKYKNPTSTTLLIAGDTSESLSDTVDFLNAAADHYERVIAVLGNHEEVDRDAVTRDNVHILDLVGHEYRKDGIAYLGGCLEDEAAVEVVARKLTAAKNDATISRVIVLSHFAPTPRLSDLTGGNFREKCNGLLDMVGPPLKDTTIVFGHVHLPFNLMLDGYRLLSDPRGYRGIRRDGSAWRGKFATFASLAGIPLATHVSDISQGNQDKRAEKAYTTEYGFKL
ncbi:metallophosphoesterase [Microvirga splendida]|uniref:Metallophosphoesterase n=1 Tax=Microvirga splendida TaxID=2795727 RepID=A0ABS0Y8E5_9HYPH|nr:metallophosphoesterase [Microvirga splendida]MBJ6128563.1 metallophosphoesterase [Microvirga splendida]